MKKENEKINDKTLIDEFSFYLKGKKKKKENKKGRVKSKFDRQTYR